MWVVLIINAIVAVALAYLGFRNRHEVFNLFNAGIVFIVFGMVLLISAIPIFNDFDSSSILMFVAGLLLIVGIIMLIVSRVTKKKGAVNIKDIAVTLAIASVCAVSFIHNLSLVNVFIPELAMVLGVVLFALDIKRS